MASLKHAASKPESFDAGSIAAKEGFGSLDIVAEGLETDQRLALAQRIVASATFAKSPRLCQFLLYITERIVLHRPEEVNEQQIGVHVFERAPNYNSGEDNIVRSQARLLRKKLDEYYAAEGKDDPIRIVVPRGAYVPVFEPAVAAEPASVPAPVEGIAMGGIRRSWARWALAMGILALTAIGLAAYSRLTSPGPDVRFHQFWAMLVNPERSSMIVPSDTALVLYQIYTGKQISLTEYAKGQFARPEDTPEGADPKFTSSLDRLPYTNIVDLNFSWQLARRSKADLRRTTIRSAREVRTADLKGVNAILIGARRSNPWVELFDKNNNFRGLFTAELRDFISNAAPQGSEPARYRDTRTDGVGHGYAVVAFVPGLTGQENVLLLSGTTSASTEGAADFVLNEKAFGSFLGTISSKAKVPHFEAVLDVETVSASAPRAKVIAYRVHPEGN